MSRPPSNCYPLPEAPVGDDLDGHVEERTLGEMEADEEERTHRGGEQDLALDDDLEADENTDWLRGYGWPGRFRHKSRYPS